MADDDIIQKISLEGGDDVVAGLDDIGKAGQDAFSTIGNAADSIGDKLGSAFSSLGDAAKDAFSDVQRAAEQGFSGVSEAVSKVGDIAGDAFNNLRETAQEAFGGMGDAAAPAADKLSQTFQRIGDQSQQTFQKLGEGGQQVAKLGDSFSDLGQTVGQAISGMSSVLGQPAQVIGQLVSKVSGASSSIGSAAGSIVDSFKMIGSAASAVGAVIGAAEWGGTAVDHLNQLRQSLNMTAGGFAQVAEAASSISMPLDSFAGTVGKINDGIKQATVSLGEQAEMMKVYEERAALFNSRNSGEDPVKRREEQAAAAQDRMQARMHRMQQSILDSANPFEAISANFAKFVQGAELSSTTLERLQKQAEALQKLPPEIRFFKAFEELQELQKTQPELASRLMNLLSDQSAKLGENLSAIVEKGKAAKAEFDRLGPEGFAKAQELKVTGADEMAAQLSKVTSAWTQMTSAAKSAGIALAAALGPVAVGALEGITAIINGLNSIIKTAENTLVALGKVAKWAVGAETPEEKKKQAERTRIETEKDQDLAYSDPKAFRQSLGPLGVVGAGGFDLMNMFKEMFMGAAPQQRQTPEFLKDIFNPDNFKLFKPDPNEQRDRGFQPYREFDSSQFAPGRQSAKTAGDGLEKVGPAADAAAAALNKVGNASPQTPAQKAVGGEIGGWGGPKSDSVPIMASKGEFVVRADGSNLQDAIDHFKGRGGSQKLAMQDPEHYKIIGESAKGKDEAGFDPRGEGDFNWHGGPVGYQAGGAVSEDGVSLAEDDTRERKSAQQIKYEQGLIKAYQEGQDLKEQYEKLKKAVADAEDEFSHFIKAPTGGLNPAYDKAYQKAKDNIEEAKKALKKFMVAHIKEFGEQPQTSGGTNVTAQAQNLWEKYTSQFYDGGLIRASSLSKIADSGAAADSGSASTSMAGGGLIGGYGTGTSDSNLIRASRGEYVVTASGSNLGDAIAHFTRGFAGGGLVEGFTNAVASIPGYASGGAVTKTGSNTLGHHQLDIRTNAGSFSASVNEDTMQGIRNSALSGKLSQTGQRPSWFS